MKRVLLFACLFIALFCFLPCHAADLPQLEARLQAVEQAPNGAELDALVELLAPEAAANPDAGFLLARVYAANEKMIARQAGATPVREPQLYSTGRYSDKAVLLIHGFTACPWEMADLGEFLQQQGINAYAMRLAGHGTKPEDLLNIKWQDWYQTVEEGLNLTRLLGKEVYVMGVSTGGALTVKLAAEHPEEIRGVVCLAPAIYLADWKSSLTGIVRFFVKFNVRPLKEEFKPYYYEERAMSAIYQLVKLTRHVRRIADKVTIPILIVQSRADKTVKPKGAEFLYNEVASQDKNIFWLEDAPHVLTTQENPREKEVFEQVGLFMQQH